MTSETDEPDVPIRCVECGTETRVPLSVVGDTLDRHNETRHDGEECARVDPELADQLADLVAEDLGLLDRD
jgi:DNA-directed RNA polymerase subunit N (RpoN/RPB10)